MTTAARELQDAVSLAEFFTPLLRELEQKTGRRIEAIGNNKLLATAKGNTAEYRGRDHHIVSYQ